MKGPIESRASNAKGVAESIKKDCMINGIEGSAEIERNEECRIASVR